MNSVNFYDFSPNLALNTSAERENIISLWQNFFNNQNLQNDIAKLTQHFQPSDWKNYQVSWQNTPKDDDERLTAWLIGLFNQIFNQPSTGIMPTILVRGNGEPEYFPATSGQPARIEFAHGFFASALHEISHWCITGKHRRTLNDFGYWYESDGRGEKAQALFEQVEIKPQAVECLLNQACGRYFYVSQDNLDADFDVSKSTFALDVHAQAKHYLQNPGSLPRDAKRLIWLFLRLCQNFSI